MALDDESVVYQIDIVNPLIFRTCKLSHLTIKKTVYTLYTEIS